MRSPTNRTWIGPGVTDLTADGGHTPTPASGPLLPVGRGSRRRGRPGGPPRRRGPRRGRGGGLGSRATCGGTRPRLLGSRADAGAHRAGETGTTERPPRHTSSHERRQVSHRRILRAFSMILFRGARRLENLPVGTEEIQVPAGAGVETRLGLGCART